MSFLRKQQHLVCCSYSFEKPWQGAYDESASSHELAQLRYFYGEMTISYLTIIFFFLIYIGVFYICI